MATRVHGEKEVREFLAEGRLDRSELALIDMLCDLAGRPDDPSLRGALAQVADAWRQGAVRVPLASLTDGDFAAQARQGSYAPILGRPGEYKPLILDQDCLYTQKAHAAEVEVARLLRRRMAASASPGSRPVPPSIASETLAAKESVLEYVLRDAPLLSPQGTPLIFNEGQIQALRMSLDHLLLAISGGPGTGKTSLCANLLRVHGRLGKREEETRALRIALAAPTGRAAQRLGESLHANLESLAKPDAVDSTLMDLRATTLHQLLDYDAGKGEFRYHVRRPLPIDLLIVDEASMVDLYLFRALLLALPSEATLILLGDKDQLPSVESGAVFSDLAPQPGRSSPLPWANLIGSHRSSAHLVEFAQTLLAEDRQGMHARLRLSAPADFAAESDEAVAAGANLLHSAYAQDRPAWETAIAAWLRYAMPADADMHALIDFAWLSEQEQASPLLLPRTHPAAETLNRVMDSLQRYRMLTLLKRGPLGTDGVNRLAAKLLRHRLDNSTRVSSDQRTAGPPEFFHGAPILVERNDTERGIANGDLGLCLRVQGRLWAAFPQVGGYAFWPLSLIPPSSLAFAVTVHKAQGSEYDAILLVLPDPDHPLLSRQILYTAVTRARRKIWILGESAALENGIGHTLQRESGLSDRLADEVGG